VRPHAERFSITRQKRLIHPEMGGKEPGRHRRTRRRLGDEAVHGRVSQARRLLGSEMARRLLGAPVVIESSVDAFARGKVEKATPELKINRTGPGSLLVRSEPGHSTPRRGIGILGAIPRGKREAEN